MMTLELPDNKSKGPYVRPLSQTLKEAIKAAQEAEWNGEIEEAHLLWRVVNTLQERFDAGEMYDPHF